MPPPPLYALVWNFETPSPCVRTNWMPPLCNSIVQFLTVTYRKWNCLFSFQWLREEPRVGSNGSTEVGCLQGRRADDGWGPGEGQVAIAHLGQGVRHHVATPTRAYIPSKHHFEAISVYSFLLNWSHGWNSSNCCAFWKTMALIILTCGINRKPWS